MIVRILGDRLYEVGDDDLPAIESLDSDLDAALEGGRRADILGHAGRADLEGAEPRDTRSPTTTTANPIWWCPHEGATLQEVRDMLDAGV